MSVRFTVLGSGSGGNASFLDADGFGVLLDAGFGPRVIGWRLKEIGHAWDHVNALLLTHLHSDHWNERTFEQLRRRGIRVFCHASHRRHLRRPCPAFAALFDLNLVKVYEPEQPFLITAGLCCTPLQIRHDGGDTFGFRIDGGGDLFSGRWSLGYIADLGCWNARLVELLSDVDMLAVEFNHDVELERRSNRSPWLIDRVLGDEGHLSNDQAAALLREVLRRSEPGRLRHVVQLHLSKECNRPELAAFAAGQVLQDWEHAVELHTARQDEPTRTLWLQSNSQLPASMVG